MRFWYDCADEHERQRLASTLFLFLLGANGVLLVLSLVAAPFLSARLLQSEGYTLALQLVLLNTFAIGFTFIPFHVLRIQGRAAAFSGLTFARSAGTVLLRLALVVGLGFGVTGVVLADIVVTAGILSAMVRWFAPLIRPMFSRRVLRQSLAFGLPRIPHGIALQVMAVGDRFVLEHYLTAEAVGFYSMGVSFGLIGKIALGAFEYAWAPFYYATAREPGAPRVFSAVTTYGVAALALMTAGMSAISADLLDVVTGGVYVASAPVVTWTAVGVFFYGVYLLTSIGLNLTSRTEYYPVSTAVGAGANIALNLVLVPRYGMIGATWANGAAYAIQAAIAGALAQRFYPVTYEYGRLARAVGAGGAAYVVARLLPLPLGLVGLVARGATVVAVMTALLWITGFFNAEELQSLNARRRRVRGRPVPPPADTTELAGEIVATDVPASDVGAAEVLQAVERGEGRGTPTR